jgi:hypothetical protein
MRLTNRLWNAIARHCDPTDTVERRLAEKINAPHPDKRKRHFVRELALSDEEEVTVKEMLHSPPSEYVAFCIDTEHKHNGGFRL